MGEAFLLYASGHASRRVVVLKFTKSHSRTPIRKHLLALLLLLYVGEDERRYLNEIVESLELQLFLPDF